MLSDLFSQWEKEQKLGDGYPLHSHGDRSRFGLDGAERSFDDGVRLIERTNMPSLGVYYSGEKGRPQYGMVAPHSAVEVLKGGGTVEVPDVAAICPEVDALALRLSQGLGCSGLQTTALVSGASRSAVPVHFDNRDVIVLQLSGTKTWEYWRNTDINHPVHSFSPRLTEFQRDSDRWRAYFPVEFQSARDRSCSERVRLLPGSALFLPSGYWHCTDTEAYSASITISIIRERWAERVLHVILDRLLADPWMRTPCVSHVGTPELSEERVLERARLVLAGLSVFEMKKRSVTERQFERAPGTQLELKGAAGDWVLCAIGGGPRREFGWAPGGADVLVRWFNQRNSFSGKEFQQMFCSVPGLGNEWLTRLEKAGVVRVVDLPPEN